MEGARGVRGEGVVQCVTETALRTWEREGKGSYFRKGGTQKERARGRALCVGSMRLCRGTGAGTEERGRGRSGASLITLTPFLPPHTSALPHLIDLPLSYSH